jgi:hypothetical protein
MQQHIKYAEHGVFFGIVGEQPNGERATKIFRLHFRLTNQQTVNGQPNFFGYTFGSVPSTGKRNCGRGWTGGPA